MFFSSDVANPDTYPHFYCDLQMYTTTMTQPDPGVFMRQFLSGEVASKANKFQGRNITRWQNAEYDKPARGERERARPGQARGAVHRHERPGDQERGRHPGGRPPGVAAVANNLHAPLSGWDNNTYALQDWYRDA